MELAVESRRALGDHQDQFLIHVRGEKIQLVPELG